MMIVFNAESQKTPESPESAESPRFYFDLIHRGRKRPESSIRPISLKKVDLIQVIQEIQSKSCTYKGKHKFSKKHISRFLVHEAKPLNHLNHLNHPVLSRVSRTQKLNQLMNQSESCAGVKNV